MGLVVDTMTDIGVTRLSRWIFNCYVIHDGGNGAPVVVDAGLPCAVHDLEPVMADLGLDPASIASVGASHAHSDHVGGAPALATRLGVPVHLPRFSRAYLEGTKPRTPNLAAVSRIWPAAFDQPFEPRALTEAARGIRIAGYGTAPRMRWPSDTKVDYLSGGDRLAAAPDWQVLEVPGHTDDSIAFWNVETQTLLSGDAVLSVGGRAWITPEAVDDVSNAQSGALLRSLDVAHLLPGHGLPVHGKKLMDSALGPDQGPHGAAAALHGAVNCFVGRA